MHLIFRTQSSSTGRILLVISSVLLATSLLLVLMFSLSVGTAQAQASGVIGGFSNGAQASIVNQPLMWPSSTTEFLSAGRHHTCYLNTDESEFICWGDPDAYPNSGTPDYDPVLVTDTKQISAGDYSTCALKNDGSIKCWSPDSTFNNSVITTTGNISLSVGTTHACAIDSAENIRCWGELDNGLQAILTDTYRLVSAGNQNDCAILTGGLVECWGNDSWSPDNPSDIFSTLAVGNNHACGIRSDGSLDCWGNSSLTPPEGDNFVEIESGSDYSCAFDNNSQLSCWGSNPNRPVVDTQSTFSMFSSGFLHTCALRPNLSGGSYLACWGNNDEGQAPRLTLAPTNLPAYLPLGSLFSQVFTSTGSSPGYTLTLQGGIPGLTLNNGWTLEGSPNTIGQNTITLTLKENFAASSLPVELDPEVVSYTTQVENASTSVNINTAPTQTLAGSPILVTVDIIDSGTPTLTGSIIVMGTDSISGTVENTCTTAVSNNQAECRLSFISAGDKTFSATYMGDGFYAPSDPTSTTVMIDPAIIMPSLSAGTDFTCATDNAGKADCWGQDDSGQASPVNGMFGIISAGEAHACGRSLNGSLSCWGWNGWGVATPPADYNFLSVTSGIVHSCGLHYDGSVSCWGNGADGRTSPPTGTTFTQISTGDEHTCGLDVSGYVSCWGKNSSNLPGTFSSLSSGGDFTCGIRAADGVLECWGNPPISQQTPPSGLIYQSLDAGREHLCAIDSNAHLACWGDNTYGQITIPDPDQTFSSVSAGANHTCALTSENHLLCWGSNSDGQAPEIAISPSVLPPTIDVNTAFTQTISATGGRESDYIYSIYPDLTNFPPGLQLDANTGLLSGTPTQAGTFTYTVRVRERNFTPAVKQDFSYTQLIRSEVKVQITNTITGTVGRPVEVFVQVDEDPGGFIAASPSLTITVEADDSPGCELQLDNGRGSCFLFFTTAGEKQIQASYAGDGNFKPGQTTGGTPITIEAFEQVPLAVTSRDVTLVHQSDGSLSCLGAACQNISLNAIYPVVSVGETQVCAIQVDGQAICQDFGSLYTIQELHPGQFVDISVGKDHVCVITPTGSVTCWGDNNFGKATPPSGSYLAISAGDEHTCAISSVGSLGCWGEPLTGTIPITGMFIALQTGLDHTCALQDSGEVACWGENSFGQSDAPEGQFLSVGVGDAHSCALRSDGQMICWGDNTNDQAGSPYGQFEAFAAAADHNCALRPGLQITCWGQNDQGEAPMISVVPLGGEQAQVEIPALTYWEHSFYPRGGLKPYQAEVPSGTLPPGTSLGVFVSPAGTILYGTPQVPGVYPFLIRWQDASPIPLVFENPYTITVTGMDLEVVVIPDHPTTALWMNKFGYDVIFSNLTVLPVSAVTLTVDLPGGLSNISTSGLSNCVQIQQQLQCTLSSMPGNSSQTLRITGTITATPGTNLVLTAQAESGLNPEWPEIAPQNNWAQSVINVATSNLIFIDPFEDLLPDPAWTNGTVITTTSGVTYLGDFTYSDTLHLNLNNLPAHQRVRISFDLYIIGPWAGNSSPGRWQFGLDGQTPEIFTTFSNIPSTNQDFPANHDLGNYPWRTGAAGLDELGFSEPDTRYSLAFDLIHSTDDLNLLFQSQALPAGARWGLDNVRVVLEWSKYSIMLPIILK